MEEEEKGPETFVEKLQRDTQRLIDNEFLDDVGFEDANMRLDLWMDKCEKTQ